MRRAPAAVARLVEEALARLRIQPSQIDGQLSGGQVAPAEPGSPGVIDPDGLLTDPTTTAGDLIYRDGSGLQRLPIGAEDQVLTVASGVPAWQAGGGGGGGAPTTAKYVTTAADATLSDETVIPGLAGSADRSGVGGSTFSEEYETSTTGLTWSPSTPTTVNANTQALSHLYIRSSDATERFGYRSFSPAGDFDVRCKLSLALRSGGTSFAGVGLIVADATNVTRALMAPDVGQANARYSISAFTYASSTYTQRGSTWLSIAPPYQRISRSGSNISFWFSFDGLAWTLIATQSLTITVTQVGFRISAGNTPDYEAYIDWLRASP